MRSEKNDIPWYAAGLAFECLSCGRCCAGPEAGYVWLSDEELLRIAQCLSMSESEFRTKYVRKVGRRQSLIEDKKTRDCTFLKNGKCSIYALRPMQCRTWPFWDQNIETPEDWSWAAGRCPGINRGQLHTRQEIDVRAGKTSDTPGS